VNDRRKTGNGEHMLPSHLQVVDRFRWAAGGDGGDEDFFREEVAQAFAAAELPGGDELLPVQAPERVIGRHADLFALAVGGRDREGGNLGRLMSERAGDERAPRANRMRAANSRLAESHVFGT